MTFCLEDKHNVNKMYSQKVIFLNFFFIILYSLSDLEATRDELLIEVHKMSQQEEGPKPDKTVSYRIYKNCFCIFCKDVCVLQIMKSCISFNNFWSSDWTYFKLK